MCWVQETRAARHGWSMGHVGQWWELDPECHVKGFGFYPGSPVELLEDFEHGNNRVRLIFRKDHSDSGANLIGRNEARGRETHLEAVSK